MLVMSFLFSQDFLPGVFTGVIKRGYLKTVCMYVCVLHRIYFELPGIVMESFWSSEESPGLEVFASAVVGEDSLEGGGVVFFLRSIGDGVGAAASS